MANSTITTYSADATRHLGRVLGGLLQAHDLILLSGDLGAGKTTFVQGLAHGVGYTGVVSSPSFVLLNEYNGNAENISLAHCDLYRITAAEFFELGVYECLERGAVAVEWHERATELAQLDALILNFKYGTADDERTIQFSHTRARGGESFPRGAELRKNLIAEWAKVGEAVE